MTLLLRILACVALSGGMLLAGAGCALMRRSAGAMLAPAAGNMLTSLQRQSDLELVREGAPAYLLLLDGLVESSPRSSAVLLAAAGAQTAYAAAFLDRREADRARMMYARARDYGLRVLARNKAFRKAQDKPIEVFESALGTFEADDVPALYITAMAWAGWIINSHGAPEALAQFARPLALMRRVLALDSAYQHGGPELFFGIYYAVQPRGGGRDLDRSREHFEKALACAGPDYLMPRVAFAEFYARYAFDRDLFEKTLREVIESPADDPDARLVNEVARRRARQLLDKADDLF